MKTSPLERKHIRVSSFGQLWTVSSGFGWLRAASGVFGWLRDTCLVWEVLISWTHKYIHRVWFLC